MSTQLSQGYLAKASVTWAIDSIYNLSDGDLFPSINEMKAIIDCRDGLAEKLSTTDLDQLAPGACRRFIVPKDEMSYRQATQLSLQDSILLTSIVYQYGAGIEARRLAKDVVFSYRFDPNAGVGLYNNKDAWKKFWHSAKTLGNSSGHILYCDIADFYNQIYHHTIENQLIESSFPNKIVKWTKYLLESTTAQVSRGLPVGPHPVHLLAEASMIPIDNSLSDQGIHFIRYVDDIIVFCNSYEEAHSAIYKIANTIDKQQRLTLQRHKTKIYDANEFRDFCDSMIADKPSFPEEDALIRVINKYTHNDPYTTIQESSIDYRDWESITEGMLDKIILKYLSDKPINFERLRWVYRRLAQLGHPGAVSITINKYQILTPCFASINSYFASLKRLTSEQWKAIGTGIISIIDSDVITANPYFMMQLYSLFSRNKGINHFANLSRKFASTNQLAQREIILAARTNSAIDWLREQKENYHNMDQWQQMAYIFSISLLPVEERKFFIKHLTFNSILMDTIAKWSKDQ